MILFKDNSKKHKFLYQAEQYEQDRITWNETEAELQKELQLLQKMSRVSSNNILASNKTGNFLKRKQEKLQVNNKPLLNINNQSQTQKVQQTKIKW